MGVLPVSIKISSVSLEAQPSPGGDATGPSQVSCQVSPGRAVCEGEAGGRKQIDVILCVTIVRIILAVLLPDADYKGFKHVSEIKFNSWGKNRIILMCGDCKDK